jgi:hypothetical protein
MDLIIMLSIQKFMGRVTLQASEVNEFAGAMNALGDKITSAQHEVVKEAAKAAPAKKQP